MKPLQWLSDGLEAAMGGYSWDIVCDCMSMITAAKQKALRKTQITAESCVEKDRLLKN